MPVNLGAQVFASTNPLVVVPWTVPFDADDHQVTAALAELAGRGAHLVEVADEASASTLRALLPAGEGTVLPGVVTTSELEDSGLTLVTSADPAHLAVAAVGGARLLRTPDPVGAGRVAGALGEVFRSRAAMGRALPGERASG